MDSGLIYTVCPKYGAWVMGDTFVEMRVIVI